MEEETWTTGKVYENTGGFRIVVMEKIEKNGENQLNST